MSQLLSQNRLAYSRDFLLKYQHIYTPDTTITSRLTPYLSPPRSNQKRQQGSNKKNPQTTENSEGLSPQRVQKNNPKKKPLEKTQNPNNNNNKARTERTPKSLNSQFSSSYKPRYIATQPPFSQKENFQLPNNNNNNNNNNFPENPGLTEPFSKQKDSTNPLKTISDDPPNIHCSVGSGLPPFSPVPESDQIVPEILDYSPVVSTTSKSQVYFYESKFASLFFPSQADDPKSDLEPFNIPKNELSPNMESSLNCFSFKESQPTPDNSDNRNSLNYSLSLSESSFNIPSPEYLSSTDSLQNSSSWSPLNQRRTPKTTVRNFNTPEGTPSKSSPASTPYRSSKTPHKTPHGLTGGRPISPLDEQRLVQRQKQIDYGYRTVGYLRYRLLVPKEKRKPEHPRTPKKAQGCSKRSWDGQLKKWRRDLHLWDPDNMEAFKALLNSELVEAMVNGNPELAEIVHVVREKLDNPVLTSVDDDDDCDSDGDVTPDDDGLHGPINSESVVKKKSSEPRLDRVARTLVF